MIHDDYCTLIGKMILTDIGLVLSACYRFEVHSAAEILNRINAYRE